MLTLPVLGVAELIRLRLEQKSARDNRRDPYHLALVIEEGECAASWPAGW